MHNKYCLPIIKPTRAAVLEIVRRNKEQYSFFEIWLDYITDLDRAFIEHLAQETPSKYIVVFRRQQLEPITMPLQARLRVLESLHGSSVLVDLDLYSQEAELAYIKAKSCHVRTIVSHHNYQKTPGADTLQKLVKAMARHKPDILKIATFCRREQDAVRLLQLQLQLKDQGQKHIILGMGTYGFATRIFGTLWGNELIFAPNMDAEQSAPGQLTRQQLDTLFAILEPADFVK